MNKFALPQGFDIFGLHIQFYAIFILCGAILAFLLASYKAYKGGYPKDTFELVFFTAFPAGIIGARIWFVIAEWNTKFAGGDFLDVFKIWEGGLAIQGGIIGGFIVGIIILKVFKKGLPVLKALDYAVPGIFIAQAIGRIGNFFNQEVYGAFVSTEAWNFLPGFINSQMEVDGAGVGNMAVPLFLIEGIVNLANYYILTHGIPAVLGKHYEHGDTTFAYFICYGITRLLMEPIRNATFQMGTSQDASFKMAVAFIVIGFVAIIYNHLLKGYQRRRNERKAQV